MTRFSVSAPQRLVGWCLRDYRESAGHELAEAARILNCHRSKISRIETGQRGIHPKELRELLTEYAADPAAVEALAALARRTAAETAGGPSTPACCQSRTWSSRRPRQRRPRS